MEFVRSLSEIPFRSPSLKDRSLSEVRVDRYLALLEQWRSSNNNFEPEEKEDIISLVTEAVAKAEYVPYDSFWHAMLQSFSDFSTFISDDPFWVIVDGRKIGSEIWLIQGLADKILALPGYRGFIRTTDEQLPDELVADGGHLVSFDDCIYSGIHMYENIFGEFVTNSGLSGFDAVAVVPFASEDGVRSIEDATRDQDYNSFSHFGSQIIEPIVVSDSIFPVDDKPYLFDMEFDASLLYPIYFDHKVAGTSSSFPTVYLDGRVPLGMPKGTRKLPIKIFEEERAFLDTGPLMRFLPDRTPISELEEVLRADGLW